MTITVNKLLDGPIIVATCQEPVNWRQNASEMLEQIVELRDTIEGCPRYYVIIDLSKVEIGFGDVVSALGALRRVSNKRRPDLPASVLLVGTGQLAEIASEAVGLQQYGDYRVQLHTSFDKALDSIRTEIAGRVR
ncbi:MAG: hypothetical protein JXB30_18960 [Anaerolineae bacterium]|nr:hypothetical protein [Anaerolineae bacterium]